jgi:hypothetical protein
VKLLLGVNGNKLKHYNVSCVIEQNRLNLKMYCALLLGVTLVLSELVVTFTKVNVISSLMLLGTLTT